MRLLNRGKKPAGRAAKAKPAPLPKRRAHRITAEGYKRLRQAAVLASLSLILAGGVGYALWQDYPGKALAWTTQNTLDTTVEMGLDLKEVLVIGRKETDRQALINHLGISVGDPILAVSTSDIRDRIESLGWVKSAEVRRILPGTLVITLVEREAVAIWQNDHQHVLIDEDGVVIGHQDIHRYQHLKVMVGPDAPRFAMDLLSILSIEPELEARVTAAQRVGQRRWNLHLDNGIAIRLPEEDPSAAWRLLADYQRDHEILSRAVGAIDLRYPDRMSVQLTKPGLQEIQDRVIDANET